MVNTHIAHDCVVGNNCILANNVTLGGHVHVDNYAVIGGMSAVHQRVRIGKHYMIGGVSAVISDLIPYGTAVSPDRASLEGLNLIGMKRRKFSKVEMNSLRKFYKDLFLRGGSLFENLKNIKDNYGDSKTVQDVIEFLNFDSSRHFCVKKQS
jgi:UDP-N-acetylglucosamine acyltransferase